MILVKIKAPKLVQALQDKDNFPVLRMYLEHYIPTIKGDTMVCRVVKDGNKSVPEIKLSLFDYYFNERESANLNAMFQPKELIYDVVTSIKI